MKSLKYFMIIGLVIAFCFFIQGSPIISEASKSQCYKCHTSAKMLIEITREIAKTRPVIKSENEGEG